MVIVASHVGFSPALGAFVMGSLLAETSEGKRIEHLILPVKDLFSAIFFVSVGMLIDPVILKEHFGVILLISFVTISGKFISTAIGAIMSGKNIKTATQAGMSLAQIGEFSFIIATLGMTLKVTSDFLYPIAVAVSAITTFTTPYLIKNSEGTYVWINKRLPQKLKDVLGRYEAAVTTPSKEKLITLLWNEYGLKVLFNAVLVIAIALASSRLLVPWVKSMVDYTLWVRMGLSLATFVICTPFLWAIAFGAPTHATSYKSETVERLEKLQVGISFVRFLIGCVLAGFILGQFTTLLSVSVFLIAGVVLSVISLSRYAEPVYRSIESKFISNLTENERAALKKEKTKPQLAPWDASLAEFVVTPFSSLVGKTLHDSKIKETYGVMITMIERSEKRILAPQRETIIWPYDRLYVIGTDEQLKQVRTAIEVEEPQVEDAAAQFGLASLQLTDKHPFVNRPIRESGLRETVNGLIVGLERNGQRILNPDSGMLLLLDDIVWIVGDLSLIKKLNS
jgi:CPA2 family monovalent cation:H+ antiporter-2